jgi:hypothetical protein
MLTRKHFEAIAQILKGYHRHNGKRDYPGGTEVDDMIDHLVGDFGDYLENENPYSDLGITDTVCPRCETIVFLDIEVGRMERDADILREAIEKIKLS